MWLIQANLHFVKAFMNFYLSKLFKTEAIQLIVKNALEERKPADDENSKY